MSGDVLMLALADTAFKKEDLFNEYSAFKKLSYILMNSFVCQKVEVRRYANGEAM